MPRLLHKPPKYWRHKQSDQAAITISGKRIYLGKYGSALSHERYAAEIRRWRKGLSETAPAVDLDESPLLKSITPDALRKRNDSKQFISINELIVVYRRHTHKYYRKNGVVTREAEIIDEVLKFLRQHFGKTSAADFGPIALGEIREKMITDLDWSRKYINKQVSRLIRMFKWAAENQILDGQVHTDLAKLSGLKKGRSEARETDGVTFVPDSVIEKTLPELADVIADMVRLQRFTGARPGEICQMRPGDIDRSDDIWLYMPNSHKTDHHEISRIVMIGPRAQKVLTPYLQRPAGEYCFTPAECDKRRCEKLRAERKTPLRKRDRDRLKNPVQKKLAPCYNTTSYRQAIRRACKRLRIAVWSPNQLRHTAATEIRRLYGVEGAQLVCGHRTADVTQVYAERDLARYKEIARECG